MKFQPRRAEYSAVAALCQRRAFVGHRPTLQMPLLTELWIFLIPVATTMPVLRTLPCRLPTG
jgi:hypothetical protein